MLSIVEIVSLRVIVRQVQSMICNPPPHSVRLSRQDDNLTSGSEELKQLWHADFCQILNVTSQKLFMNLETTQSLNNHLTCDEQVAASEKMK